MKYKVIVYGGNLEEIDETAEIISAERAIEYIKACEKVQQSVAKNACPYCLGKGKEPASGIMVRCRFCGGSGKKDAGKAAE